MIRSSQAMRLGSLELALWVGAILFVIPLYLLVVISFKSPAEVAQSPFALPEVWLWENYRTVWLGDGTPGSKSLAGSFVNSVVLTAVPLGVLIALGAMAGYGLARATTRITGAVFAVFALGIILPFQLGLIPLFGVIRGLGLTGNVPVLMAVYIGILMPLAIALYTGFIRALPPSLEEAARIDGAGSVRIFFAIVLPQLRPVTAAMVILGGLAIWNDVFLPVVFLGGSRQTTLPVAIYQYAREYVTDWQLIFAGIVIACLPIVVLFFLLQKYLVNGLNVYHQN